MITENLNRVDTPRQGSSSFLCLKRNLLLLEDLAEPSPEIVFLQRDATLSLELTLPPLMTSRPKLESDPHKPWRASADSKHGKGKQHSGGIRLWQQIAREAGGKGVGTDSNSLRAQTVHQVHCSVSFLTTRLHSQLPLQLDEAVWLNSGPWNMGRSDGCQSRTDTIKSPSRDFFCFSNCWLDKCPGRPEKLWVKAETLSAGSPEWLHGADPPSALLFTVVCMRKENNFHC